jgi:hypothetical protein
VTRKICIHGHFYQPPRENPWTGVVRRERSAAPWHDWNERISDECYRPNSAARILDGQGRILKVSDNYSRISYDFGPTLLTWLEREQRELYENIIGADACAKDRFSGHGNALAHPYHHVIMPLLSRTDKETEVRWGVRDFEDRFGRYPEGLWLPEMAVDIETLDVLADHGILFTILSPHQASRMRNGSDSSWTENGEGVIDPTAPYICHLPGGNRIIIFFHDSGLGTQVAFGDLLMNGDRFSEVLLASGPEGGLVHFATDGETFGHHHQFGEMALAWCLDRIESSHPGTLTIYGEYLEAHAPEQEVEITGNTSWSCPHGIRRWSGGCTCESGRHPGWGHDWRGPLRNAVNTLSMALSGIFGQEAGSIFPNPWSARDDAIRILRDSSPVSTDAFLTDTVKRPMDDEEQKKALALLEMARHCLVMQTSCAWFFDDIADREVVQILCSAARAIQLARDWTGTNLEPAFLRHLSTIRGNRPEYPDGGVVYTECVLPLVLDLEKEAACLALMDAVRGTSCTTTTTGLSPGEVFACGELYPWHDLSISGRPLTYCFLASGSTARLGLSFSADQPLTGISGPVLLAARTQGYEAGAEKLTESFPVVFTPADLPQEAKQLVLHFQILTIAEAFGEVAGDLFDRITAAEDGGLEPVHSTLHGSVYARCLLISRIERLLASPESTVEDLQKLATTFSRWGITLTPQVPREGSGRFLRRLMEDWACHPDDSGRLAAMNRSLRLLQSIGIRPPLWDLQNIFIGVRDNFGHFLSEKKRSEAWWEAFRELGSELGVNIEMTPQRVLGEGG